jgi:hypothetical protein
MSLVCAALLLSEMAYGYGGFGGGSSGPPPPERLVNKSVGVCSAIFDSRFLGGSNPLPIDCGCANPSGVPMPEMPKVEISIELKCAVKNGTAQQNAEFNRNFPSKYSEDICRAYRRELVGKVGVGISDAQLQKELRRRIALYLGSYKPYSGRENFYACMGAIDFMSVKLCPNIVPKTLRTDGEASADRIARCKNEALSAIRGSVPSGSPDLWRDPNSEWVRFEDRVYPGREPDAETYRSVGAVDRDYLIRTFEETNSALENLPIECKQLTQDTNPNGTPKIPATMIREQEEFNERVEERAKKQKEKFLELAQQAAENWETDSQLPLPNPSGDAKVMFRMPCDTLCDLKTEACGGSCAQ